MEEQQGGARAGDGVKASGELRPERLAEDSSHEEHGGQNERPGFCPKFSEEAYRTVAGRGMM